MTTTKPSNPRSLNAKPKSKQNKNKSEYLQKSRQIHLDIPMSTYEKWEQYQIKREFRTMTAMITQTIQNTIDPILPIQMNLDMEITAKIANLTQELHVLTENLTVLLQEKDSIITSSKQSDPRLEEKILKYLKRSGKANEYVIANDLNENTDIIFFVLSNLKENSQVCQDDKLNWEIR